MAKKKYRSKKTMKRSKKTMKRSKKMLKRYKKTMKRSKKTMKRSKNIMKKNKIGGTKLKMELDPEDMSLEAIRAEIAQLKSEALAAHRKMYPKEEDELPRDMSSEARRAEIAKTKALLSGVQEDIANKEEISSLRKEIGNPHRHASYAGLDVAAARDLDRLSAGTKGPELTKEEIKKLKEAYRQLDKVSQQIAKLNENAQEDRAWLGRLNNATLELTEFRTVTEAAQEDFREKIADMAHRINNIDKQGDSS